MKRRERKNASNTAGSHTASGNTAAAPARSSRDGADAIERVFLGWDRPALERAVDYLACPSASLDRELERADAPGDEGMRVARHGFGLCREAAVWDLGGVLVVVPGARAGRRLLERLTDRAAVEQVTLFPPAICTVGQFPEQLYPCRRPYATTLVQQIAWADALRRTPAHVRGELLGWLPTVRGQQGEQEAARDATKAKRGNSSRSSADVEADLDWEPDDPRWFELAILLWKQHRELAADGLSCEDVVRRGQAMTGFSEAARWRAFARVQRTYLNRLDQLDLWDRQTARMVAIERHECHTSQQIVLLGTVDMNQTMRRMLDQVAHGVTTLIQAPAELQAAFDQHGCVVPELWAERPIEIRDEHLRVVDGPVDQAAAVVAHLASFDGAFSADQITIGVPDETMIPRVQRELATAGCTSRFGPGRPIESTRPLRLLRAAIDYLSQPSVALLAELVRHPDLRAHLRRSWSRAAGNAQEQHDLLSSPRGFDQAVSSLDDLIREHLPSDVEQLVELIDEQVSRFSQARAAAIESHEVDSQHADSQDDATRSTERPTGRSTTADARATRQVADAGEIRNEVQSHVTSHVSIDEPLREAIEAERQRDARLLAQRLAVKKLVMTLADWLSPLLADAKPPGQWASPVLEVLLKVYGDRKLDPNSPADHAVITGCDAIGTAMQELTELPSVLLRPVRAHEAVLMALATIGNAQVSALPLANAIELLGWLELSLDDAPALIVTHLNEGFVPTSASSDLFLPDALRTRLGLDDNARRYARDAYALSVLCHSKKQLRLVVGRRDEDSNPLRPSRLLFAVEDDSLRVARALRLFGELAPADDEGMLAAASAPSTQDASTEDASAEDAVDAVPDQKDAPSDGLHLQPAHHLVVPHPTGIASSDFWTPRDLAVAEANEEGSSDRDNQSSLLSLSVTDFKNYLACPYRFLLNRVYRLRSVEPEPEELDGAAFGNRMHEITERFGFSDAADSTDPRAIAEFLMDTLRERFRHHYGSRPRPMILLQQAQLEERLLKFADVQAQWRQQGWRIVRIEGRDRGEKSESAAAADQATAAAGFGQEPVMIRHQCRLEGEAIVLRGRIDRMDVNDNTNTCAVLDYKSSDAGDRPEKVHHRSKRPKSVSDWVDLQLPLYRYLARSFGYSEIQLGYISVPRQTGGVAFRIADWTTDELKMADAAAAQVIRAIRNRLFWPPQETAGFDVGLNRICQTHVFDPQLAPAHNND